MSACTGTRSSDGLEQLGEEVLKKKEGIDIQLKPIQEQKKKS
jgi:hypothetical protein